VEQNRPDPSPGRLVPLDDEADNRDAADLLMVLRAVKSQRDTYGRARAGAGRAAREALWWMWERPRLPGRLIRSKYPVAFPWSANAREAVSDHHRQGRPNQLLRNLVIEHLYPWSLVLEEAIERSTALDPPGLRELLYRRYAAAVITVAEDKTLSAAGVSHKLPPDAAAGDEWCRARHAGLDVAGFAPLEP
jgi:hypothetical protein